jgi:hypothetical protein
MCPSPFIFGVTSSYLENLKSNQMKRRVRRIVNFFAFNLLFFAVYLNFIHKDQSETLPAQTNAAAFRPVESENMAKPVHQVTGSHAENLSVKSIN